MNKNDQLVINAHKKHNSKRLEKALSEGRGLGEGKSKQTHLNDQLVTSEAESLEN